MWWQWINWKRQKRAILISFSSISINYSKFSWTKTIKKQKDSKLSCLRANQNLQSATLLRKREIGWSNTDLKSPGSLPHIWAKRRQPNRDRRIMKASRIGLVKSEVILVKLQHINRNNLRQRQKKSRSFSTNNFREWRRLERYPSVK